MAVQLMDTDVLAKRFSEKDAQIKKQSARIAALEAALRDLLKVEKTLPPHECFPDECVCGYKDFQRALARAEEVLRGKA